MLIYIILLFLIFIIHAICGKKEKAFMFLSGMLVFILMALKNESVGTDTRGYVRAYLAIDKTVNSLLHNFPRNITIRSDSLFFFYTYLFSKMGFDVKLYLAISYGIITFLVFKWMSIYSRNKFISVFTYITIGLFALNMSALRQALAVSIATISYQFVIERKFTKFIITSIVAIGFHASALVLVPMYPIVRLLEKKRISIVVITIIVIGFLFSDVFYYILSYLDLGFRFSVYLTSMEQKINPLLLLFYIAIVFSCLMIPKINKVDIKNNEDINFNMVIFTIGIVFLIFSLQRVMISRLGYYYIFVLPVMIANAIQNIHSTQKRFFWGTICCIFEITFFLITTPSSILRISPYLFFWQ